MAKKLTENMATEIGYGESYQLDGRTYLVDEQPELANYKDSARYEARAVRVGDEIEDDQVDTHTLYWHIKTPKEHGYRICGTTVINAVNENGYLTVDDLIRKYGIIHVYDDGQYIPVEKPDEDDGIISCLAVRYDDDLDDDGDIKVYSVSWFASDDEIPAAAIRHNGRQVVDYDNTSGKRFLLNDVDVQSYEHWQDHEWYVMPEDDCDWDTPAGVDERTGYTDVDI